MPDRASAEPPSETLDSLGISCEQWSTCREHLEAVSRTFSKPIGMLPGELSVATMCGYLICRVVDTIEDHPDLPYRRKSELFDRFLGVLDGEAAPEQFTCSAAEMPGEGAYLRLCRELDEVMAVFESLPRPMREGIATWAAEMAHGMRLYNRRRFRTDATAELRTVRDLERYCYFVAGTVGHMLTELFVHFIDEEDSLDAGRERTLRANAERFGLGLQMVNILKDQTEDLRRGWCYVPRTLAATESLRPSELYEPDHREEAHGVVEPLFERTSDHLDGALEYALAIPSESSEIRVACLVPLWMAVRTLEHARGNDAMFVPDAPVKIDRDEVAAITDECITHVADDDALRERYERLWQRSPAD